MMLFLALGGKGSEFNVEDLLESRRFTQNVKPYIVVSADAS